MVPVVSLPPIDARPTPPGFPGMPTRSEGDEASAGGGKPFDVLLSERRDLSTMPVPPQGGDEASAGAGKPFDILSDRRNLSPMSAPPQDGDARRGEKKVALAPTVAEMFNEHGFFAGAAQLQPLTPGDPAPPRSEGVGIGAVPARSAVTPMHAEPQAPSAGADTHVVPTRVAVATPATRTAPIDPKVEVLARAVDPAPAARFAGSATGSVIAPRASTPHAPRIVAAGARASAPDPKRPASDGEGFATSRAHKRLAAVIEEHVRRTSATGVRVEVRAAADGLLVAARADGLDRAERSRLLTEIEALLSRHGRVPARISVNGEPAPTRRV